jgi:hypothetical protein
MTDGLKYGRKALKMPLVKNTWKETLKDEQTLAKDWPKKVGVLVGVGESLAMMAEWWLGCWETGANGKSEAHILCYRHGCGRRIPSRDYILLAGGVSKSMAST